MEQRANHKRRRRVPLVVVAGVLILVLIAGLAVVLSGVVPFPGADRSLEDGPVAATVATNDPFLLILTPKDMNSDMATIDMAGTEVYAIDLDGRRLANLGPVSESGPGTKPNLFLYDRHRLWTNYWRPANGAEALAWPGSSTALVALQTPSGWDLLRYDASVAQVHQLAQGIDSATVRGYPGTSTFLVDYGRGGNRTLLAAGQNAETAISLAAETDVIEGVALSPDGRHAAYSSDKGYVARTDGTRSYRLRQSHNLAIYSPNGKHLILANNRQLVSADADGRNGVIIADAGRSDSLALRSVGDKYIVAVQQVDGRYELRVLDWDGRSVARLGSEGAEMDGGLLPNDAGLWILHQPNGIEAQLEVTNIKGEGRQTIIEGAQDIGLYATDKDLVIVFQRNGSRSLLAWNIKSKTEQILEQDAFALDVLAISDGQVAYAVQSGDGWRLMVADLSRNETREADAGATNGYPQAFFDQEGNSLVYEARGEAVSRELFDEAGNHVGKLAYDLGDIYLVDTRNPKPELVYKDANLLAATLTQ